MVPATYHDFFLGAVTIGGALTGLLFVAISVHPAGLTGADTSLRLRIEATSALSALVDALFISLLALLPGGSIGGAAVAFGISGTLTMATLLLLVIVKRQGFDSRWRLLRMIVLVVGQGSVYVIQVVNGVNLNGRGSGTGAVDIQTILVAVFLGFGVARAWEYVGGQRTGILGTVDEAQRTLRSRMDKTAGESAAETIAPRGRADETDGSPRGSGG